MPDGSPSGGGTGRSSHQQTLNTNPQGVAPQVADMHVPSSTSGSATADNRRTRDKIGEAAGVALGRAVTGGAAAVGRTVGRAGNVALSAGVAGVEAFKDSSGSSLGGRLGNARLAATGAGAIALTAAGMMTGRDFSGVLSTSLSEGKMAYAEGADSRIAAYKESLRSEAPISAGAAAGSGSGGIDTSYDARYAGASAADSAGASTINAGSATPQAGLSSYDSGGYESEASVVSASSASSGFSQDVDDSPVTSAALQQNFTQPQSEPEPEPPGILNA